MNTSESIPSVNIIIQQKPPFPYVHRKDSFGYVAKLDLGEFELFQKRLGPWVVSLVSDKLEWRSSTTEATYFLEFRVEQVFNCVQRLHESAGETS